MADIEPTPYPPSQKPNTRNWKNFAAYLEQLEFEQSQKAKVSSARKALFEDELPNRRAPFGYDNEAPLNIRKAASRSCSPPPQKRVRRVDFKTPLSELPPVDESDDSTEF
jgi:hypothetical protein